MLHTRQAPGALTGGWWMVRSNAPLSTQYSHSKYLGSFLFRLAVGDVSNPRTLNVWELFRSALVTFFYLPGTT